MPGVKPNRKRTAEHLHKTKKPTKRFKKQKHYHSSSDSEDDVEDVGPDFAPVNMDDSDDEIETTAVNLDAPVTAQAGDDQESEDSDDDTSAAPVVGDHAGDDDDEDADALDATIPSDDEDIASDSELGSGSDADTDSALGSEGGTTKKRKRNDPSAFATSMSKILSSKLSVSKRSDPVLSRSAAAATANKEMIDQRLEQKAKQKLRAEKKASLERARVKDVLGLSTEGVSAADVMERERRLKKTAQRGVVKLFNAVRAAQVQADVAREQAVKQGVIGVGQRQERVSEMSKQGFLDLIAKGGKKTGTIEEG